MASSSLGGRLEKTMTVLLCVALFSACSKKTTGAPSDPEDKTSRTTAETDEIISFDYRVYFSGLYEDRYEFVIQETKL